MSKCQVCETNPSKYTCPRCSYRTCSLPCCRKHKETTNCSGQRDKTKFLKKEEFTELDLLSDYKFLEESSQVIDTAQRQFTLLDTNQISNSTAYTGFFDNLRKFVHSEFNITLNLMPNKSTRHTANKSRFNRASKIVSWSIEFVFHLAKSPTSTHLKLNTKKNLFSSKETLTTNLRLFYDKYKSELFEPPSRKMLADAETSLDTSQAIALYTEFNESFEAADFDDLNVLFQVIDVGKSRKYFIKLDLNESLENVLRNKTLLEYPTFYIVKTENLSSYDIQSPETVNNDVEAEIEKRSEIKGEAEEGECDTDKSDEFEESEEEAVGVEEGLLSGNGLKRSSDDVEITVEKKLKTGEDAEDGELDDSN